MMSYVMLLKPGERCTPPPTMPLHEVADFPIVNDNAVILYVPKCYKEGIITVGGGDGPMASGDTEFMMYADEDSYIYLETGRYGRYVDGKLVIRVWAEEPEFQGSMIQLI